MIPASRRAGGNCAREKEVDKEGITEDTGTGGSGSVRVR